MAGALILAGAGHRRSEAEDRDFFVPMAHVAGTTVIKRQIRTLKKAGITNIAVVSRPEHVILERHLAHLAVSLCYCKEDREMLDRGLEGLAGCEQVVLVPGNLPLFLPETVTRLLAASGDLRVPVWKGNRGSLAVMTASGLRKGAAEGWRCLEELWPDLFSGEGVFCKDPSGGGEEQEKLSWTEVETGDEGVALCLGEAEDIRRLEDYARRQKEAKELDFQVKLVLRRQEDFFGPGIAEFMLKIQETGSILAACQEMNMSYSKGWKMVNKIEEEMGMPFLIRKNGGKGGGSSVLTPEAEIFVKKYYAFLQDVNRMAENFFEQYYGDFL